MEENIIMFDIILNHETHLWNILTNDRRGKDYEEKDIGGGNQIDAMSHITKALLKEGYTAAFKMTDRDTLNFFDEFEMMIEHWTV